MADIQKFARVRRKNRQIKYKGTGICARSRDRTGTALLPLVFETSASTNSAIRAYLFSRPCYPGLITSLRKYKFLFDFRLLYFIRI